MATRKKSTPPAAKKRAATRAAPAAKAAKKEAPALPTLGDLGKMLKGIKLPGIDLAAIVDAQRKDMEALAEANRLAYQGMKELAERRNEMLKESLAQWQQAVKAAGGPDVLNRQAELARERVKKAIANIRELAQIEADARRKAWKVLRERFLENQANLQKLIRPQSQ